MIRKFVKDKWYRYTGTTRGQGWNNEGLMDFMLDGKPRKCTKCSSIGGRGNAPYVCVSASFKQNDSYDGYIWNWSGSMDLFEEYTPTEADLINDDFEDEVIFKRKAINHHNNDGEVLRSGLVRVEYDDSVGSESVYIPGDLYTATTFTTSTVSESFYDYMRAMREIV